jgi:hypothetical protein
MTATIAVSFFCSLLDLIDYSIRMFIVSDQLIQLWWYSNDVFRFVPEIIRTEMHDSDT